MSEKESLFSDAQRDALREMLAETLTPEGVEFWLRETERTGKSYEDAEQMADALRSGVFI